ncbi:MAG: hypothetical protein R3224_01970 [Balneolaceae bacterium]|nr:hypothetical protein [Balneolaceae bacterium]
MKPLQKRTFQIVISGLMLLLAGSCAMDEEQDPRLSLFIGVDVSGSFVNSGYYEDSINFLSHYIYAHLNGLEELEEPNVLFVSSIGGAAPDEPKTFYPIQTFENLTIEQINEKLHEIFPKEVQNPFTDFNAFFEQIALTIRNRNLVLRPVSVVMVTDGKPDAPNVQEGADSERARYRNIDLSPLERLSRNITVRVLYTDPVTGKNWQTLIPRRRVKIWTQDAEVMTTWNDSTIYVPERPIAEQDRWLEWTADNVDYGVRARRVD